jgi:hypothetical protein
MKCAISPTSSIVVSSYEVVAVEMVQGMHPCFRYRRRPAWAWGSRLCALNARNRTRCWEVSVCHPGTSPLPGHGSQAL